MTLVVTVGVLAVLGLDPPATAGLGTGTSSPTPTSGPASKYDCALSIRPADADYTGIDGTASEIGWEGNHQGVVTCLGGVFYIQDTLLKNDAIGFGTNYGFGIYDGGPTTWTDADGYLPAQITSFSRDGAKVSITEFCDEVVLGGDAFVAVYSRVAVTNPTDHVIEADPQPSPGLVPLDAAPDAVAPHTSVDHDYVIASDRFGATYPWPSAAALADAGTFDQHFAHMASFWNDQLAAIAGISVPDRSLDDAYRSGFIYTQIARSGDDLNDGVNGYEAEFNHDVIGILSNLFNQGYFTDADALAPRGAQRHGTTGRGLLQRRGLDVLGALGHLPDEDRRPGLREAELRLGGTSRCCATEHRGHCPRHRRRENQPRGDHGSHRRHRHARLLDDGRLLGPHRPGRLPLPCPARGGRHEAAWATQQYTRLLSATNKALDATIARYHLDYLPCSIFRPNTANGCKDPKDANWMSPLGAWAWDGAALRSPGQRPGRDPDRRHLRLRLRPPQRKAPPQHLRRIPGDYYSTAYNAGYGTGPRQRASP